MSDVKLVGVHPGAELGRRTRLFAALAEAHPEVRFEARGAGETAGLDALIELGGSDQARGAAAAGLRALACLAPEAEGSEAALVSIAPTAGIDPRLRGQKLPDRHLTALAALAPDPGAEVVARTALGPAWTREGNLDLVAVAPAELGEGEPLRNRLEALGPGRSLALLPLLEMLRKLTAETAWRPPPLRATFLLDDPNLHWPSYGFLSLPRLDRHAAAHGYHMALAMVPLDARVSHPGAVRLLRQGHGISLCVHGNDHFGAELGRVRGEDEALALAALAVRRMAAFERRTRLSVSPVMIPPHEECSEAMAGALARTGYAAITMTRPFPWLSPPPRHWLTAPVGEGPLVGWSPADVATCGLPVLSRHPFAAANFSPAELALRAYLDQPLILYGHHDDLGDGYDLLAERATAVNRLGDVRWGSLQAIASNSVSWRLEGDLLRLRPHSRLLSIPVPAGATRAVVEPLWGVGGEVVEAPGADHPAGEPFEIAAFDTLTVRLRRRNAVDVATVAAPRRRSRPLLRRLAGEARDRAAPARRRFGGA